MRQIRKRHLVRRIFFLSCKKSGLQEVHNRHNKNYIHVLYFEGYIYLVLLVLTLAPSVDSTSPFNREEPVEEIKHKEQNFELWNLVVNPAE